MTLSNWLGLALLAVIITVGLLLYFYYKRKFIALEGFEGIIIERGASPRRLRMDARDEYLQLQKLLKNTGDQKKT